MSLVTGLFFLVLLLNIIIIIIIIIVCSDSLNLCTLRDRKKERGRTVITHSHCVASQLTVCQLVLVMSLKTRPDFS